MNHSTQVYTYNLLSMLWGRSRINQLLGHTNMGYKLNLQVMYIIGFEQNKGLPCWCILQPTRKILVLESVRPSVIMMTSSNGNIFRVTGPLCGEFTGPGEFPTQRPMTQSFDVFFDLRLNKPLSKQSQGWWFETLSRSLWRHRNDLQEHFFDLMMLFESEGDLIIFIVDLVSNYMVWRFVSNSLHVYSDKWLLIPTSYNLV